MDGSVLDDMTSKNNLEEPLIPFAMSYSDCPERHEEAVVGRDPCAMDVAASEHAHKICSKVGSTDIFKNCLKRISWSHYREICIKDTCANSSSFEPFCSTMAALAHECCLNSEQIDWLKTDPTIAMFCRGDYAHGSKTQYTENLPRYQTCRDVQARDPLRSDECVAGIHCKGNKLLDDYGACKSLEECTCYDVSTKTVHDPGAVITKSCSMCVCQNASWNCSNEKCADKIECPGNQVYRKDLKSCGRSCSTYGHCQGNEPLVEGCGCPDGQVFSEEGQCISPSQCPCKYNSIFYKPNDLVTVGCKIYKCRKRKWELHEEKDCKGRCFASGDPHYQTFDGYHYTFQGGCQYILSRTKKSYSLPMESETKEYSGKKSLREFVVMAHNVPCGSSGVTCTKLIDIQVGSSNHLQLIQGKSPMLNNQSVGSQFGEKGGEYKFDGGFISGNGMFLFVSFDSGLELLWDGATRIYIMLSSKYSGKVEGLCGDYDGNYLNDFSELSEGNLAKTPNEFSRLWKTSPLCPDADLPQDFDPCVVHPHRADWAKRSCSIITEGHVFRQCRLKVTNFIDFYKDCLYDACGCDSGGDCECLCTAVAAFSKECSDQGIYVSWRSQHFCPVMCDGDKIYKDCASPCKQTCSEFNRQHSIIVCQDASCVEGCVCPDGKVEGEDGSCIDISQCHCIYENNKTVAARTNLHLNCQNCTCIDGVLKCTGTPCNIETVCLPDEFMCTDKHKCISLRYVCDHHSDCDDRSDEQNCVYACSPDQYTCVSDGECIAFYKVCDGVADCTDGSDESSEKCQSFCEGPNFFQCDSKKCIVRQFVCDGHNDCGVGDDSDERNCTYCDKRSYRCFSGLCLPMWMRCDGHDDCGDNSDEMNCVCKDEVVLIEKKNHDFEIFPEDIEGALLPEPTKQMQLLEGLPIIIRFKGIGKSRFIEVSLWASNVGQATLLLFNSKNSPISSYSYNELESYFQPKEAAAEYKWISKTNAEPMQQIVFIINEVIWSDVAKLMFKSCDSDGEVYIKSFSAKVCYDGKFLEEMTTGYELHPDATTLPPEPQPLNCSSEEKLYFYNFKNSNEFRITSDTYNDAKKSLLGSHWTFNTKDSNLLLFRQKGSDWFIPVVIRFKIRNANAVKFAFYDYNKNKISVQKKQIHVSDSTWFEVVYATSGNSTRVYMLEIDFFKYRPSRDVEIKDFSMKACLWIKKSLTYKTTTKKYISGKPTIEWEEDYEVIITPDIESTAIPQYGTTIIPTFSAEETFPTSVGMNKQNTTLGYGTKRHIPITALSHYFSEDVVEYPITKDKEGIQSTELYTVALPPDNFLLQTQYPMLSGYQTKAVDKTTIEKRRKTTEFEPVVYNTEESTTGYKTKKHYLRSTEKTKYGTYGSSENPTLSYTNMATEKELTTRDIYPRKNYETTTEELVHPTLEQQITNENLPKETTPGYTKEETSVITPEPCITTEVKPKTTKSKISVYPPEEIDTIPGYIEEEMPLYPLKPPIPTKYLTTKRKTKKTTVVPLVNPVTEVTPGYEEETQVYPETEIPVYPSVPEMKTEYLTTKGKKRKTTLVYQPSLTEEIPVYPERETPAYPVKETPVYPERETPAYPEKETPVYPSVPEMKTEYPTTKGQKRKTTLVYQPSLTEETLGYPERETPAYPEKETPVYPSVPEMKTEYPTTKGKKRKTTLVYQPSLSEETPGYPERETHAYPEEETPSYPERETPAYPERETPGYPVKETPVYPERKTHTYPEKETPLYPSVPEMKTEYPTTKGQKRKTTLVYQPSLSEETPGYPERETHAYPEEETPSYPERETPAYPERETPSYPVKETPVYPERKTPAYPEKETPVYPSVPEMKTEYPTTKGKKRKTTLVYQPSLSEETPGYPERETHAYPEEETPSYPERETPAYPERETPSYPVKETPVYPERKTHTYPEKETPVYPSVPEMKTEYPTTKGQKRKTTLVYQPSLTEEIPVYPERETPAYPVKETPVYPERETPAYPEKETPLYPSVPEMKTEFPTTKGQKRKTTLVYQPSLTEETPGYPERETHAYPEEETPGSPVKETPSYPKRETPAYPEKETPVYPSVPEMKTEYPTTKGKKRKTTLVYQPSLTEEIPVYPERETPAYPVKETPVYPERETPAYPEKETPVYPSVPEMKTEYPTTKGQKRKTTLVYQPSLTEETLGYPERETPAYPEKETPVYPSVSEMKTEYPTTKGQKRKTTLVYQPSLTEEIPVYPERETPAYPEKETPVYPSVPEMKTEYPTTKGKKRKTTLVYQPSLSEETPGYPERETHAYPEEETPSYPERETPAYPERETPSYPVKETPVYPSVPEMKTEYPTTKGKKRKTTLVYQPSLTEEIPVYPERETPAYPVKETPVYPERETPAYPEKETPVYPSVPEMKTEYPTTKGQKRKTTLVYQPSLTEETLGYPERETPAYPEKETPVYPSVSEMKTEYPTTKGQKRKTTLVYQPSLTEEIPVYPERETPAYPEKETPVYPSVPEMKTEYPTTKGKKRKTTLVYQPSLSEETPGYPERETHAYPEEETPSYPERETPAYPERETPSYPVKETPVYPERKTHTYPEKETPVYPSVPEMKTEYPTTKGQKRKTTLVYQPSLTEEIPVYPERETPAYPVKETPVYPERETPAYPEKETPLYPSVPEMKTEYPTTKGQKRKTTLVYQPSLTEETPGYPERETHAYPEEETPGSPVKETPSYPKRETPAYPEKETPVYPSVPEMKTEYPTTKGKKRKTTLVYQPSLSEETPGYPERETHAYPEEETPSYPERETPAYPERETPGYPVKETPVYPERKTHTYPEKETPLYPSVPEMKTEYPTTKGQKRKTTLVYQPSLSEETPGYPERETHAYPEEETPSYPERETPAYPERETPSYPVKETPVYPERKTPAYPEKETPVYPSVPEMKTEYPTTKGKKRKTTLVYQPSLSEETPGYPERETHAYPEEETPSYPERETPAYPERETPSYPVKETPVYPERKTHTYPEKETPVYPSVPEMKTEYPTTKGQKRKTTLVYQPSLTEEIPVYPERETPAYPEKETPVYPSVPEMKTEYPTTKGKKRKTTLVYQPSLSEETPGYPERETHAYPEDETPAYPEKETPGYHSVPEMKTEYPTTKGKKRKTTLVYQPPLTEEMPVYPERETPGYPVKETPAYPEKETPFYPSVPEMKTEYPTTKGKKRKTTLFYPPEVTEETPGYHSVPEMKTEYPTTKGKKRKTTLVYQPPLTEEIPVYPEIETHAYPEEETPSYPEKETPGYPERETPGYPVKETPAYPERKTPFYPSVPEMITEYPTTKGKKRKTTLFYPPEVTEETPGYHSVPEMKTEYPTTKGKKRKTTLFYPPEVTEETPGYHSVPEMKTEYPTTKGKKRKTTLVYQPPLTEEIPVYPEIETHAYPEEETPSYPEKETPGYPERETPGYPVKETPAYPERKTPFYPSVPEMITEYPTTKGKKRKTTLFYPPEVTEETPGYHSVPEMKTEYPTTKGKKRKTTLFYPPEVTEETPGYHSVPEMKTEYPTTKGKKRKTTLVYQPPLTEEIPVYPEIETHAYPEEETPSYPEKETPGYPERETPGYPVKETPAYPERKTPFYPSVPEMITEYPTTKGKKRKTTLFYPPEVTEGTPVYPSVPEMITDYPTTKGEKWQTTLVYPPEEETSAYPVEYPGYPVKETPVIPFEPKMTKEYISTKGGKMKTTFLYPSGRESTYYGSLKPKVISPSLPEEKIPPMPEYLEPLTTSITKSDLFSSSTIIVSKAITLPFYGQTCSLDRKISFVQHPTHDFDDGPIGWIEKDNNASWFATSEEEYVYLYDEVDENVEVHISACTICICEDSGHFTCKEHIRVTNIPGVCCKCISMPPSLVIEKCQLKSSLLHVQIEGKEKDDVCKTAHTVNITYCIGSCPGLNLPHIRNEHGKIVKADISRLGDIESRHNCECCIGVKGSESIHELSCNRSYSPLKIRLDEFSGCVCLPCGTRPGT